jgi:hypothetical protein
MNGHMATLGRTIHMNSTYSSIALLAALALPISAIAADNPSTSPAAPKAAVPAQPAKSQAALGKFESIDANKDGYITRDEAKKSDILNQRFTQLDLDRDGKLSGIELKAVDSPAAGGPASGSPTPKAPK